MPHVLIGCFGECTEETINYIKSVWNIIKNTQNGIEEILSETKDWSIENPIHMEEFLQETRKEYETLKEDCDNLEGVFAEYGYDYNEDNEDNILNQTDKTYVNINESSDQNLVEGIENLEVEFTPNLSWKCKIKQNGLTSTYNDNNTSHTLSNSLASISNDISITHKDFICTPGRERPQEPIYSRHFYNILKK